MGDVRNKHRIMKLQEIFIKDTDEENQLSVYELINRLKLEFGDDYDVDKKAILDDIQTLDENKFYILKNPGDHNKNLYSHQNRSFELYELRMLIDAVSSARFVTKEETRNLIEKIKKLTSKGLAKKLQNQIFLDQRVKSEDQQVKLYIDKIHTAISQFNKIEFQYGNYNVDKDFSLHRQGVFYQVTPLGLIWSSDYYYLIGKDNLHIDIVNYRVDRMRKVKISEEKFIKTNFNVQQYINSTFNMYTVNIEPINIKFDNHLINVVIDRFGKDIDINKFDEKYFTIRVNAAISKGLIRWILTWGSDTKVLSPISLIDEMRVETEKMKNLYK